MDSSYNNQNKLSKLKMTKKIDTILDVARKALVGREFFGEYIERRYVEPLRCYREVIVLDKSETELRGELRVVLNILNTDPQIQWPSISEHEKSLKLWVCFSFDHPQPPFGPAKWSLQSAEIRSGELLLIAHRVKISGSYENDPPPPYEEREVFGMKEMWTATTEVSKMAALVLIAFLQISGQFFIIVAQLIYKTLDVLPNFIHSITPLFLAIIDAITKCVGGLFILFAMWKNGTPVNIRPCRPSLNDMTGSGPERQITYLPRRQ